MKALKRTDADLERLSKVKKQDVDDARGYWKAKAKSKWRGLIEAKPFRR